MIENIEEKQLETKQDSEESENSVDTDEANEISKNAPIHEKENDNPEKKYLAFVFQSKSSIYKNLSL